MPDEFDEFEFENYSDFKTIKNFSHTFKEER
jgi:hypothetical protein